MLPVSSSTASGTGGGTGTLTQSAALLNETLPGGISVGSLISQFEASQASLEDPLTALASEQSTLSTQSQAWSQVLSAIQTVANDASALSTAQDLAPTAAPTSSDASLVTASGPNAPAGTYEVTVSQLAQDQVTNSAVVGELPSTSLGYSGTLTIDYGGQDATVTVGPTDSLEQIATNLNTAAASLSGLNLSATVLPASGGGSVLSLSAPTGASSFSVGVTGTDLPLTFTTVQSGAAAEYSVNGVANTSNTNTVANALAPGVSLDLLGVTATPVTLTATQDDAQVASAVNQLVSDVQGLASTLNSVAGQGGALEGNAALNSLSQTLVDTLTGINQSLPSGYQSLADIGLDVSWSTGQGQQITFNQSSFLTALEENPSAVAAMFTGPGGLSSRITQYLRTYTDPASGIVESAQSAISSEESAISTQETTDQALIQQEIRVQDAQFASELQAMLREADTSQALQASFDAMSGQSGGGSSGSGTSGG